MLSALVLALAFPGATASGQAPAPSQAAQPSDPRTQGPGAVSALGAVVWDPMGDRVLWGKDELVGRPMASTTKIMTTLLAIEAGTLDDEVTISRDAAQTGGAGLGLREGQRIPMRSLLAGLMIRSGNDAATAVAEHVAGDEAAFVARMNARAAELGLRDTNFVNSSGLTDSRTHRAAPLDLARLAEVAMAHPEFARWAAADRLTVPGLPPMENRNELIGRYRGADGVKTGYLAHAGLTLVASATRDGMPVYVVVLGSQDSFADATRLLDWAFATYRPARAAAKGAEVGRYRWAGAETPLAAGESVVAAVRRDADVRRRVRLRPVVEPPVLPLDVLGELELVEDGRTILTGPVHAAAPVARVPRPADPHAAAGAALQEALRVFVRLHPTDTAS